MADHDDDLPPSEEELAASKRLRDALEDASVDDPDADLARSLRAAFAPSAIAADEHAQMIEDVASPEELELAAKLSRELDADPLVAALHAAWSPTPLSEVEHRAIVEKALPPAAPRRDDGGRVIRVRFGMVAGVVALAASVFVWMSAQSSGSAEVPLARARSTQPLFGEPFKSGDASARIDKIAIARASDYRDNRFAKWGVR